MPLAREAVPGSLDKDSLGLSIPFSPAVARSAKFLNSWLIDVFCYAGLRLNFSSKSVVGLTSGLGVALLEVCMIRLKYRLFQNDQWQNSGKTH